MLFVTNDFGPRAGGIESFVIGLIERRPFGSTIIYTSYQDGSQEYDAAWLRDYGVRVVRDKAKILLPTPRVQRAVNKVIRTENVTVAAFGAAAPLALLSASMKRAGINKTVALTHGHEVWWSKLFPFNLLMRRIGHTVDSLTYLGDFTKGAISKSLSARGIDALVKIAPGIDTQHFAPTDATDLRLELGIDHKRVIVSVGRLVHRKGQDYLLQAMPLILESVPDAHLLLVGEGPYREHLEGLVSQFNLSSSVTFIGRVQYKDLPLYICAGQVFAMPSRSRLMGLEVEGLGIVYLEASACGLPVIAGASGGAPDAVLESITGLVVDGKDERQIANAAIELLSNPDKARAMGESGREWIMKFWRWEIWSEKFNALLKQ